MQTDIKKRKGREEEERGRGQECHFPTFLSPQPVEINKIRGVVSSSIIVNNESVFQQMAPLWVSASKRPPLSVSASQFCQQVNIGICQSINSRYLYTYGKKFDLKPRLT